MDLTKIEERRALIEPLMEAIVSTGDAHEAAWRAFDAAVLRFKRQYEPDRASLLVGLTEAAQAVVDTEAAKNAAFATYQAGMDKLRAAKQESEVVL